MKLRGAKLYICDKLIVMAPLRDTDNVAGKGSAEENICEGRFIREEGSFVLPLSMNFNSVILKHQN